MARRIGDSLLRRRIGGRLGDRFKTGAAASAAVTPLTIWGANVVAWYSSKDSDMYVENTGPGGTPVSNGSAIGYVQDLSGNGYHITQATAGNKPVYRSSHASFNNQPVIDFVSSDYLQKSLGATYTQPVTVILLYKATAATGTQMPFDAENAGVQLIIYINASNNFALFAGSGTNHSAATTNTSSHAAIFNGASSKYYVNGGTADTDNPGSTSFTGITLGMGANINNPLTGQVAELVAVDGAATPAELNQLLAQWLIDYGVSYTEITA